MRIQFEIKESLINILDQLMHSDFWATEIKEDESGKKIIKIKDLAYNLEAVAEVMGNEIFIRTALSKYTYRIYEVKGECWCEYVGAYRGFLEQKLLPIITPKENLLGIVYQGTVDGMRRTDVLVLRYGKGDDRGELLYRLQTESYEAQ